jgi:NADH:ubiquinone oxidoreductase subunit F (NADH-binding)
MSAAPAGLPRLLAGVDPRQRPISLADHAERYGNGRVRPRLSLARLVELVESAGLTGRGGAGFPTARKLRAVASGRRRPLVVANGIEGEPASAKDALLLRAAPHLVLDGAVVASCALGADEAIVCVPRRTAAAESVALALDERRREGIDPVAIRIEEGPRRYVGGEETALMRWLDGGTARPLGAPPRPFERGVGGRPTLVQNVETLAHLALISRFGADWFRSVGRADAPGSALFSVSGIGERPRVAEAALGTPIARLLAFAGMVEEPQAVLVGGYFGTWLPWGVASGLALAPADLHAAGASLGAGVLVALPQHACGLAETARVVRYLAAESAGQCGPCRLGLDAVATDLAQLTGGGGPGVLARLRRRLGLVDGRGGCRLPDGAVRLVASALTTFGDHVERDHARGACRASGHPVLPVLVPPRSEADWR